MVLCVLTLTVAVSGCGAMGKVAGLFRKDNLNKPSELTEFEPTLQIRQVWRTSFGKGTGKNYLKLHPLLDAGTLFVVDHKGDLGALSAEDGKELWDVEIETPITSGVSGAGDRIAIGTDTGEVVVLDAAQGTELWRRQLSSEVMAIGHPDFGIVVARTNDSRVYGLDEITGEIVWTAGRTAPVLTLRGQSKPLVAAGKVIVGYDDGKLVALSQVLGNVLWQTTIAVPEGRSELERMVDIDGVLRLQEGVVYVAGFHGRVAAVSLVDGRILWSRDLSSSMGLDLDDDHVFVTDAESNVWALDRRTGASLWKQDKLKYRRLSAPAVVDRYVVVGDFEGYTHWLNADDGTFAARYRVDRKGLLSQPLVNAGRVYIAGNGGNYAVLEPELEEAAEVQEPE
ncbi:MAG: outer membrane protein assembly factor BamB [Gammaproteobacteria bacterium]|jgi:outer membrane protein assembly factor BamB|nr:outer membrane protein assembly factor BamB [Gammaproteobacteria bacterium]